MTDARTMCEKMQVSRPVQAKVLGRLDCRLVLIIMKLHKHDDKQLTSFGEVGKVNMM